MDRVKLSRIDEQLDSSEVAELCFLCQDVVNRKRLEGISDAKGLFMRLDEKCLLDNASFLSQLLHTIRRPDLLSFLNVPAEETDSRPILSNYRVMLYTIYEDLTQENLDKMKFLLSDRLSRRQLDNSETALAVFTEMEKSGLICNTDVSELHLLLQEFDQQLAAIVQNFSRGVPQQHRQDFSGVGMNNEGFGNKSLQPTLSVAETQPNYGVKSVSSDARPSPSPSPSPKSTTVVDHAEYYAMVHKPRGFCVIINNEDFLGFDLMKRRGTQEDERALRELFGLFGFEVVTHNNLTAKGMRSVIQELSAGNFLEHDALVICVLSHGELGCVFGTDEEEVKLKELTLPFRSGSVPTLAGKPKLFFIQACQGGGYQKGALPCPKVPGPEDEEKKSPLEDDAGPVQGSTVPFDADFLLGMATVEECKSFRHARDGSIYIQELCKQLRKSAESSAPDDILSVLTRVNREVSKGEFLKHKQMPEPKYTLTKKLVLEFV